MLSVFFSWQQKIIIFYKKQRVDHNETFVKLVIPQKLFSKIGRSKDLFNIICNLGDYLKKKLKQCKGYLDLIWAS